MPATSEDMAQQMAEAMANNDQWQVSDIENQTVQFFLERHELSHFTIGVREENVEFQVTVRRVIKEPFTCGQPAKSVGGVAPNCCDGHRIEGRARKVKPGT